MCDYSLAHIKSRPAAVGDRLITKDFGTGTRGFASPDDLGTAVCVLPGTEIAFDKPIDTYTTGVLDVMLQKLGLKEAPKVARFRQINKEQAYAHHDALELADGTQLLLTYLTPDQHATILQLPAAPKTAEEAKEQERLPMTEQTRNVMENIYG